VPLVPATTSAATRPGVSATTKVSQPSIVATLLRLLFTSTGVLITLALGAAWLAARPSSRAARRFLLIISIGYAALSVYGFSYLGERLLARGYQPFTIADAPTGRTAIVVLGSGGFTARDWWHSEYTISSGGSPRRDNPNAPTAVAMRQALLDLGIPADRILEETQSTNTSEEAAILRPMLNRLGIEQVVLVTSTLHMRRSVGSFRAAGIDVIPAVARNAFVDRPWRDWWLPSDYGLWEAGSVAHELAGIAGYYVQGHFSVQP
jgi:uncharacterized SAM-binding protein YcdF (DUF218 family)